MQARRAVSRYPGAVRADLAAPRRRAARSAPQPAARAGPVELPNRIVSTAHQTTLVHESLPTEDFVAYHQARARGGVGLIVLEATAVHPSGL